MAFSDLLAQADAAVLGHLGGLVTYAPEVGAPVGVPGVFDESYVLAVTGDPGGPGVESARPAVFFRLADLPVDPDLDNPLITTSGGRQWRVTNRQKDGIGGVVLFLREAA